KAKITKKDQRRELRTSVNSAKNLKTAENREPVIAVGGRTSSPAAASSASSAPTPKNSDITRLRKGAAAAAHRRTESSETIGGFTDKDVTIQRNDTTKHQYVQMVKIDEDCGGTSQLPKKRAAKSVVSEDKSLSYESLPEWAKVHWRLVLIPTLLDVIGSQENPWEFDRQSNSDPLLALIQELVDSIYPEDHEDLDSKSKVFRIARQAICNWRSGFIKAAHAIIEKDIRMRKLNTADVQEFVRSALVHGTGYAFWENPGEGASGALKSPYILKTFATHITATEGSQAASLELADWQRGALALAATAVRINSRFLYATNCVLVHVGSQFREDTVGNDTASWAETAVQLIVDTPGRFEILVDLAGATIDKKEKEPEVVDRRALIFDP
ncbi:hypothetical protein B0H21DRAFT_714342, partial [Amylocystis lapponica]